MRRALHARYKTVQVRRLFWRRGFSVGEKTPRPQSGKTTRRVLPADLVDATTDTFATLSYCETANAWRNHHLLSAICERR
jgi:hypothetical protein